MRSPQQLDALIEKHKAAFNEEPTLIMLHQDYLNAYRFYFKGRLHSLCCGKGALYSGIPAIITSAQTVEDFLICY